MILLDTNLLIYAFLEESPKHRVTKNWLEQQFASGHPVAMPWAALLGFVRICSNRGILQNPVSIPECWAQVVEWLELKSTWIPAPSPNHRRVMGKLLGKVGNKSDLIPDAHLAALAIEHDLTLCSADQDFRRFQEVRWHNPLAATT